MSATTTALTAKQRAAMRIFAVEDECWEGDMHELWPLIRRPRLVTNGLLAKGLVMLASWDDEAGYELLLTDAGRDVVRELAETSGGRDD